MSRYGRAYVEGGVFIFTVTLADRSSDVLVRHIDRLRCIYMSVQERYPFQTIAICVLPDHLHAVWSLPRDDANFPLRWSMIKSGFSRGLPGDMHLERHVDYIHFNPVKHGHVSQVCDWPHTSTAVWRVGCCRWTGAGASVTCQALSENDRGRVGTACKGTPLPTLQATSCKPFPCPQHPQ
jgi:putative transposase